MTGLLYTFPLSSSWLQAQENWTQSKISSCLELLSKDQKPLMFRSVDKCGKILLLFQAAVAYASQDIAVTFISRQPLTQMPLSVHGMPRPDLATQLKTLTFMYMSSADELIQYCSAIHSRSLLPEVLIVDDLEFYLSQLTEHGAEAGAAKLLAALLDAVCFVRKKSDTGSCVLLLACRGKLNHLPAVLRQFKYSVANITSTCVPERRYKLELKTPAVTVHLGYQIQDSGVYLGNVDFIT